MKWSETRPPGSSPHTSDTVQHHPHHQVWRHSALGVPPSPDDPSAPPVFAYQVIALCEFVAVDRYTKHLAAGKPASSSSSSSSSSAPSSGTPARRQQQQQGAGAAAAAAAAAGESQYYVVEEDAHLVVRHLLLFKDPAVLSRQGKGNPSPARALPTPGGGSTGTLTRRAAAGAGTGAGAEAGQAPGAAAGVAGAGAAGAARARRPRGWADHLFVFLRAACFLVVLVMLLDGLERLLTKTGTLQHPSAKRGGGGGGRKRGAR